MTTQPIIELRDIWKSYGKTQVLKGINLKIMPGDFIILRGKSGVGKSTLLRITGLIDKPDKGKVIYQGRDTTNMTDKQLSRIRLEKIGYIFQLFNLIPWLTVTENIELPMKLKGTPKNKRRETAHKLLKKFGLQKLADRYPAEISVGERQRIAVIRALTNNPQLILADEPAAHLDEENTQTLMNLLRTINKAGIAILIATTTLHQQIPATKDYTLKNGKIIPTQPNKPPKDRTNG